jgi:FdhE protein
MTAPAVLATPWAARRERADVLRERYPFAREPLALYRALVDVQEPVWSAARLDAPSAADVPGYAAERVLPRVIEATAAAGPRALAEIVRAQFAGAPADARAEMIRRWLDGEEQTPVERYLARASVGPVLEALGDRAADACAAGRADREARDPRHCPVCGALPQLAFIAAPPESLAAGPRSLQCSRCGMAWAYPRLTCASCGESDTSKLTVLAEEGTDERTLSGSTVRGLRGRSDPEGPEPRLRGTSRRDAPASPRFPQMRIDACAACSRYLLSIDLGRDPRAVPAVDELAALPLDLYAVDRGFTKVTPNLMGA